jgi:hypothetical protein
MFQNFLFNQAKGFLVNLAEQSLDASGVIKNTLKGELTESELLARWKLQTQLERQEQQLEEHTGEDLELNTPIDIANSAIELFLEEPLEKLTKRDWNVDTPLDTADSTIKYLSDLSPFGEWSLKDFISQQQGLLQDRLGKMPEKLEGSLETVGDMVEGMELAEAAEATAGNALSGAFSYVLYQALKEFLSLEGARRRGELSNGEVVKQVAHIAWKSAKQGVAGGLIFGVAVVIFGQWILVPLAIIAPFALLKMTNNLWQAFWQGLNNEQQQELIDLANELGGNVSTFFNNLKQSVPFS